MEAGRSIVIISFHTGTLPASSTIYLWNECNRRYGVGVLLRATWGPIWRKTTILM